MDFQHVLFIQCLEIWMFVYLMLVDFTSLESQAPEGSAV